MAKQGGVRVLVVDDDTDLADTYASQLADRFAVETAYSGEAALSALGEAVDIVLLDRRMPTLSGSDVLDAIRDRELDIRVAMVTSEQPDFDIIEMPFDDYVQKPASATDLVETVEHLKRCLHYEEQVRAYYALTAKRSALVENKTPEELAESEQFQSLEAELADAREALSDLVAGFDASDFDQAFKDIERTQSRPSAD
jgi:DNA-binding response OmpR family regulator